MNARALAVYETEQLEDETLVLRALHVLEIEREWYGGPIPRVDELIDALRERLGVMDEVCSKDSVNLFRGFVYV